MPPACKRVTFVYRNYEGLGIGYLASYVRSLGHEVQLVLYPDPWSDTYVKQKDKDSPMVGGFQRRVDRELAREVQAFDPDVVAFSTVTDDYQWCRRTAGVLKAATGAVTVFGGVHVTSVPERVVTDPNVDFACLGEGERALGNLLEQLDDWQDGAELDISGVWYERDGEIKRNTWGEAIQDLDNLPFPAKDLFYARLPGLARTYTVTTSRGCPYKCSYCYNAVMLPLYREQGKWLRQRSVDNVMAELHWAKEHWRPKHVLFMDDVFASSKRWVEEFAERYGREIGIPFALITEAVIFNKEEVVSWLKDAGLVNVQIGVQTLNDESRSRIDRPESRQQLERAFTLLHQHKIHYQVDHMLGIPGETVEDQRVALDFYNRFRPDIVSVFWLKYYPKLPIIEFAKEKGILGTEDIDDIEEGRNEASYLFGGNAPDFKRLLGYNMLFGWLNFLPPRVVRWFLHGDRVDKVAWESFVISSTVPRMLSTVFRRPDFRGRDHVRRMRGQLFYIARLVLRDWRRGGAGRDAELDALVANGAPPPREIDPETVVLGRRSGGKIAAVR
jgi:radical SAM superfamily enzyme YgiQ (UPF0313 family)